VATPVAGQGGFIRPEPKLDPATAQVRNSFLQLRDTLHTIAAASARLQRDVRVGTDAAIVSHARTVLYGCASSLRGVDRAKTGMLDSPLAARAPAPRKTALERSFLELRGALDRCSSEFKEMSAPGKPSEIRDYGVSRSLRTQAAVQAFENSALSYLQAVGIKVRPYGSGASPFASGGD
jgi:hypothetical protein